MVIEPDQFPGLPGPVMGPGGAKIDRKTWYQIFVTCYLAEGLPSETEPYKTSFPPGAYKTNDTGTK